MYTIRAVLHAALSFDEASTWHGHREVYRDPCARGDCFRNHRDYGVAYSTAVEQGDGTVLVKTGQVWPKPLITSILSASNRLLADNILVPGLAQPSL